VTGDFDGDGRIDILTDGPFRIFWNR